MLLKDRKKVIFFIDSLGGGGAERVVSVLANELVQRYQVMIVMLRKTDIPYSLHFAIELYYAEDMGVDTIYGKLVRGSYKVYKKIRQGIIKPILLKLNQYDKIPNIDETSFYFYAQYAMPYREFLRKNEGATAFGLLIRSNIALLMASGRLKIRKIFCERNNPVRPDIPSSIIKMRDRLYARANGAVFQTEEQRAYYIKLDENTTVIPNPIKENLPQPYVGERRKEIVNFCRLNKQKNIPLLIDSFSMLLSNYPDYNLRIYGRGPDREKLLTYIEKKGLQEKAYIEDFQSNIHDIILDAAMFVSTSDYEGLSNSMIEAMAIGLPCVCTDCGGGGAKAMIRDHINGILVPVGDHMAVYHAMKEIIEKPEMTRKLSEEAVKIRQELSIDKIASQWEQMI